MKAASLLFDEFEFYDRETAEEAIACAQAVLKAVREARERCA